MTLLIDSVCIEAQHSTKKDLSPNSTVLFGSELHWIVRDPVFRRNEDHRSWTPRRGCKAETKEKAGR